MSVFTKPPQDGVRRDALNVVPEHLALELARGCWLLAAWLTQSTNPISGKVFFLTSMMSVFSRLCQ